MFMSLTGVTIVSSGSPRPGEFISTFGWGVISTGASGTGDLTSGSDEVTGVITTSKVFLVGQTITGTGIPAGTTIVAVGAGTITLSEAAEKSGSGVALSVAEGAGVVPTNDEQTIAVTAEGGTYTLTFSTPDPSPSEATTGNLPFDASSGEVQSALEGLANIGAGNVTVTGASGGAYTATFQGARFTDSIVTQLQANSSNLTGENPTTGFHEEVFHEAVVATSQTGGGGFEVCTVAADCQAGISGTGANQISNAGGIAVDNDPGSPSYGDVYVLNGGNHIFGEINPNFEVVDKFSSSGEYLGQIIDEELGDRFGFGPDSDQRGAYFLGVAVAANGELLVYYDYESSDSTSTYHPHAFIEVYSDKEPNAFVESHPISADQEPGAVGGGLAVDAKGNFYTVDENREVVKLNSAGETAGEDQAEREANRKFGHEKDVSGLAVEQSSDDVYIDDGLTVGRFSEGGSLVESLGSGELQGGSGVAVSSQSGVVYVADAAANVVDVFSETAGATAAEIDEESVANVGESSVTLQARIDPNGTSATYHLNMARLLMKPMRRMATSTLEAEHWRWFERCSRQCGADGFDSLVCTYDYRVVAVNAIETAVGVGKSFATNAAPVAVAEACPNAGLRSEQPFGLTLPDCRAYEMVSPLDKNDSDAVIPSYSAARSSLSGEAVTYASPGIFAGAEGGEIVNQYLARRGSDGWSTQAISPPVEGNTGVGGAYRSMAFTPELSAGVVLTDVQLDSGALVGYKNLYVADFATSPASVSGGDD